MVDTPNTEEMPSPVPGPPKPKPAIVVFLMSSTGRLIIGGVLLFTVVVVAGAFLFFSLLNPTAPVVPITPGGGTVAPPTSLAATRPPDMPLDDTYTFRNPFVPTVKPVLPKAASTTTTSTETSTSTSTPADTLVLTSITTESG